MWRILRSAHWAKANNVFALLFAQEELSHKATVPFSCIPVQKLETGGFFRGHVGRELIRETDSSIILNSSSVPHIFVQGTAEKTWVAFELDSSEISSPSIQEIHRPSKTWHLHNSNNYDSHPCIAPKAPRNRPIAYLASVWSRTLYQCHRDRAGSRFPKWETLRSRLRRKIASADPLTDGSSVGFVNLYKGRPSALCWGLRTRWTGVSPAVRCPIWQPSAASRSWRWPYCSLAIPPKAVSPPSKQTL